MMGRSLMKVRIESGEATLLSAMVGVQCTVPLAAGCAALSHALFPFATSNRPFFLLATTTIYPLTLADHSRARHTIHLTVNLLSMTEGSSASGTFL